MYLTFPEFDARSRDWINVIDQDTGKKVGYIQCNGSGVSGGGIYVSLFGNKYHGGGCFLANYRECVAFVKGVEAVLNRMISTGNTASSSQQADAA